MWSFQASEGFWMDVYFKPLLCQSMRGAVWDLSGEVAWSVGGWGAITASAADKRFHKGSNTCWSGVLTGTNWYHLL